MRIVFTRHSALHWDAEEAELRAADT